jgi:hypothetical protein
MARAQFAKARAQNRPRRASGTFFPCPRVLPVYDSVYEWVPRTWFCPVFHGARPVSSPTGVGHFFPVSPFFARVLVRVRVGASYMVLPSFPWHAPSFVPDGRRAFFSVYPFFARVRVGASYMVLPSFAWRASSFVHGGSRALCYRVLCSRVPVLNAFGMCTRHWPYWVIAYVLQGTLPFLLPMT